MRTRGGSAIDLRFVPARQTYTASVQGMQPLPYRVEAQLVRSTSGIAIYGLCASRTGELQACRRRALERDRPVAGRESRRPPDARRARRGAAAKGRSRAPVERAGSGDAVRGLEFVAGGRARPRSAGRRAGQSGSGSSAATALRPRTGLVVGCGQAACQSGPGTQPQERGIRQVRALVQRAQCHRCSAPLRHA